MSQPSDPPVWHWWLIAIQKTLEAVLAYDKPGEAVGGTVEVTVADKLNPEGES